MIVDCGDCAVRGPACSDCVVSVLLGVPGMPTATGPTADRSFSGPRRMRLEQDEREAMDVLAAGGLVPRLRLVGRDIPAAGDVRDTRGEPGAEHAAG